MSALRRLGNQGFRVLSTLPQPATRFSQLNRHYSDAHRHHHSFQQLLCVHLRNDDERSNTHRGVHSTPLTLSRSMRTSIRQHDPKDPHNDQRKLLIEIDSGESKVEQSIKQLLAKHQPKNSHYTFIVDKRSRDELLKKQAAALPPVDPWYKRLHKKEFWVGTWQTVKHELAHYRDGFKLLWTDTKIAWRLTKKILNGASLTRRERRQYVRTASDLFRLVPFSVFIIVPGMEFVLPFAIKFFPNMLPSQFQNAQAAGDNLKAQLKVRLEMAKFLQDTVEDMAVERKKKGKPDDSTLHAEFSEFLEKNRSKGFVSTKELLRFAPLFRDDITLSNMSRPQLTALCRLLGLTTMGTDTILEFRLRMKLREIRADDFLISKEGIDSLSVSELQTACRERGMRAIGISYGGLRDRLQQWLDLHLNHNVPISLLLLTRVLYLPDAIPSTERIRAVLESLPDSIKEQAQVELLEAEGYDVDARLRLKIINAEEEKIKKEKEEREKAEEKTRKDQEDKERAEAETQSTKEKSEELQDKAKTIEDSATPEPVMPSASVTAPITASPVSLPECPALKQRMSEADDALTLEDCLDLALIISELSGKRNVSTEFKKLQEEIAEHKEDVQELQAESSQELAVSRVAERLSSRVESMLQNVGSSMDKVEQANLAELDLDRDGVISLDELKTAMNRMKTKPSEAKMSKIAKVLDADHDGKLHLDDLQKVLNLIAHESIDVRPEHLAVLVELVEKESEALRKQHTAQADREP